MNNSIYYYIPLFNKEFTFENIFSSESISPINFYAKRGFGIPYFYKIDKHYSENLILLYSVIPQFQVEKIDGIKFILAIRQSEIEKNDIIFISEGIIGLQKTIYLTKDNFKILFFSEKDMKFVLAKSELSLPTKSVKKYYQNFEIIEDSLSEEVSTTSLENIKLDDGSSKEILFDKRYNTIKGFIYGLITEIAFEKSPEEIKLKRSIQQLINVHAEFKNRLELRSRQSDSRYVRPGSLVSASPNLEKILDTLKILENLVGTFFPKTELSTESLSKIFFDNNKSLFSSIEDAFVYLRHKFIDSVLLNSNDYNLLKRKAVYGLKRPDANTLIELLKDNFQRNFSKTGSFQSTRSNTSYNDDEFKELVMKLSFVVEDFFASKKSSTKINFDNIIYDASQNKIDLKTNFGSSINATDEREYILLANIILQKSKKEKGEARKDDLLEIVKEGASGHAKNIESSDTLLYKYLNGQLDVYPLDKVSSVVMKNFVAFIFNPDSLEALEKFLQVNEIQNKWMAYSFWCGFNGFANISSSFLKPIFEQGLDIQDDLDKYLGAIRQQLAKELVFVNKNAPEKENQQQEATSKETDFYEKFIKDKFKLKLEDLITVLEIKKDDEKLKVLKNKYSIEHKIGKQILQSYKDFIKVPNLF